MTCEGATCDGGACDGMTCDSVTRRNSMTHVVTVWQYGVTLSQYVRVWYVTVMIQWHVTAQCDSVTVWCHRPEWWWHVVSAGWS